MYTMRGKSLCFRCVSDFKHKHFEVNYPELIYQTVKLAFRIMIIYDILHVTWTTYIYFTCYKIGRLAFVAVVTSQPTDQEDFSWYYSMVCVNCRYLCFIVLCTFSVLLCVRNCVHSGSSIVSCAVYGKQISDMQ